MRKRSAGALAIIAAGERLFAERGPDVPLLDISRAAGNNNKSGVQYHFGDRTGLISAIVELRLEAVEEYAHQFFDEIDEYPAEKLIRILVTSLRYAATSQGSSHYCQFLETMRIFIKGWPTTESDTWARATDRLRELAPGESTEIRNARVSDMATVMFALLADYERNPKNGDVDNVVEMVSALFMAPNLQH